MKNQNFWIANWQILVFLSFIKFLKEVHSENNAHAAPPLYVLNYASVLHAVEGLALVMLCQIR